MLNPISVDFEGMAAKLTITDRIHIPLTEIELEAMRSCEYFIDYSC